MKNNNFQCWDLILCSQILPKSLIIALLCLHLLTKPPAQEPEFNYTLELCGGSFFRCFTSTGRNFRSNHSFINRSKASCTRIRSALAAKISGEVLTICCLIAESSKKCTCCLSVSSTNKPRMTVTLLPSVG